ncbi:MAG: hypothetical protein WAO02_14100 [Verrucomicrobiia bacterium]
MNERTLSSVQTFWMKFVFPTIWISGFGLGTLGLFVGVFHEHDDAVPPGWMKWQFLAIWTLGSIFIWWTCGRLKKVRTDGSAIYVSNYLKEVQILLDSVREVTENRWINIHPVTIHFRHPTPFGDRIVFMPTIRFFSWRSHPVVSELRELSHVQAH